MKKSHIEAEIVADKEIMALLNQSVFFHFRQIHNVIFRFANKKKEAPSIPIKMEQMLVLLILFYLRGHSQQEVADLLCRDKSSILTTTVGLEKKGFYFIKKIPMTEKERFYLSLKPAII